MRIEQVLAKPKLAMRELKGTVDVADWNAGQIDILLAHLCRTEAVT